MPNINEQRDTFNDSKDDLAYCALSDEELSEASGGVPGKDGHQIEVGDAIYVDGSMYLSSDAREYTGGIWGRFRVQRVLQGRPAPILLKSNVGWVKASSCTFISG